VVPILRECELVGHQSGIIELERVTHIPKRERTPVLNFVARFTFARYGRTETKPKIQNSLRRGGVRTVVLKTKPVKPLPGAPFPHFAIDRRFVQHAFESANKILPGLV
jgi:hypothetical protein